jgi:hypothetical protein
MKTLVRILGVLLALFMLITSVADILGVLHRGGLVPGIGGRFRQNFIAIVAGILLMVNWKKVKKGAPLFVYLVGLFGVNLWYSAIGMRAMAGFFAGRAGFMIVPVYLVILGILWGTFWMAMNDRFAGARR